MSPKESFIRFSQFFILSLCLGVLLYSCDNNTDNPSKPAYRVNQVRNYVVYDSVFVLFTYQYQDGRLISGLGEFPEPSTDSVKYTYEYPSNSTVIVNEFYRSDDTWSESFRNEYTLNGDFVIRKIRSVNQSGWSPYLKIEYSYSGDLLTQETWYEPDSTGDNPSSRVDYIYSGGKLTQSVMYDYEPSGWEKRSWQQIYYSSILIDSIVVFNNDSSQTRNEKCDFFYSGEKITHLELYDYLVNSNSWVQNSYQDFTYDEFGNLTSSSVLVGDFLYRSTFTYEKGEGNYSQLDLRQSGAYQKLIPWPAK
jgi:hypothetical protein